MSWTAILVLALGAYMLKAIGLLVLGPATLANDSVARDSAQEEASNGAINTAVRSRTAGIPMQLGQLLPPALLAALVVSQTVVTGTDLVLDARLAGVLAGGVAAWRKAPFWAVLIIAAAVSATIRLLNG